MEKPTTVEVEGITFRAAPEFGMFCEADDPKPSGTVGRLMMPMNEDGTPDVYNLTEIEVDYEEA